MDNLLAEAMTLTFFGMGFVFTFLALMVVLTSLMSALIKKTQSNLVANTPSSPAQSANMIDEETRSIIEQAIKIHTGA